MSLPLIRKPTSGTRASNGGRKISTKYRPEKTTSSYRNRLKFGMVTNNLRLFSKMQKYGIPKFCSQWHFNFGRTLGQDNFFYQIISK